MEDLHMRKICAKLVPKNLSDEQKDNRVLVSREYLDRVTSEPDFLQRRWILGFRVWSQNQKTEFKVAYFPVTSTKECPNEQIKSETRAHHFFNSKWIVHKEFVPPGQTVNQTFYLQVPERLRNRVVRVRRENANTWFLHHDNAPSHTSFAVREFLAQHNIPTLPHPPYSPDLASCDFFLFPKLKTQLKGNHFWAVENIQAAATRALNNISSEDFLLCYEEW